MLLLLFALLSSHVMFSLGFSCHPLKICSFEPSAALAVKYAHISLTRQDMYCAGFVVGWIHDKNWWWQKIKASHQEFHTSVQISHTCTLAVMRIITYNKWNTAWNQQLAYRTPDKTERNVCIWCWNLSDGCFYIQNSQQGFHKTHSSCLWHKACELFVYYMPGKRGGCTTTG